MFESTAEEAQDRVTGRTARVVRRMDPALRTYVWDWVVFSPVFLTLNKGTEDNKEAARLKAWMALTDAKVRAA